MPNEPDFEFGDSDNGPVSWNSLAKKPSKYPPRDHRHDASDIDGLVAGEPEAHDHPAQVVMNTPAAMRPDTPGPVIWLWGDVSPQNIAIDDVWITSNAPGPPPVASPADLVLDYSFDEGSGTTADSSVGGAPTITEVPGWVVKGLGYALQASGTGASLPATNMGMPDGGTLMFKVRANSMDSGQQPTILSSSVEGTIGLNYLFSGDKFLYVSKGAYVQIENTPIPATTWRTITLASSGPDIENGYVVTTKIYIDAVEVYEHVGGALIPDTSGVWNIGGSATVDIDNFRLWDVTLTPEQVYTEMFR